MSIRTLQRLYPYSSFPNLWIEGLLDCLWNNWNHHLFVHESLFAKTEHQYSTDKCASSIHIFMPPPPLKKGAYRFATVGRSVGMSVCRSVDQVLSGQYLLTPLLDQYQTWCRGCPQWVDDAYWFSGHMFKGQGQTTLLSPLCCPLNIFWPLYLINTKLGAGVALNE